MMVLESSGLALPYPGDSQQCSSEKKHRMGVSTVTSRPKYSC